MKRSGKLKYRLAIPTVFIIAVLMVTNIFWAYTSQEEQAQTAMREQAVVLTRELNAVWNFMAINQNRINYDSAGNYDFKGLHCSIVGLSISNQFSQGTDYKIRYVSDKPRNSAHGTDEYETMVMEKFRADPTLEEYDEISEFQGNRSLRYLTPLRIDESCVDCHGGPAGETDITGYAKEGLDKGDLYGAISIVVPSDIYDESIRANVMREGGLFLTLILVCVVAIYFFVNKVVTAPLERLKRAVSVTDSGRFDIKTEDVRADGEIRDLTEYFEQMGKELNELTNNLENKVELRTSQLAKTNDELKRQQEELEVMNERLEEESQYKSEFLAIMSHELRTPLTSVIAFTEILQEEDDDRDERRQHILREIRQNASILLGRINNILDAARLENGRADMNLQIVDLVDVVNSAEVVVEPLVKNGNIEFTTQVDPAVPLIMADADKLRRVVENLVGNAIKFTPDGGRVCVRVTYRPTDTSVQIEVEDTGIGISEDDRRHIFEKFTQGDSSTSRPYNGSGLGLALAQDLVKLHGGTIEVASEPGRGSVFTVVIPVREREGEAHGENTAG